MLCVHNHAVHFDRHCINRFITKTRKQQQIINDMGSIQANSERIASAIEEQGIVMNQVSESITELNTISDNNMHSAQQCLTEVNTVSSQATEMDNAVAVFKTHK